MPLRTKTSLVIDQLLKLIAVAGAAGVTVAAPNSAQALEKPLGKIIKRLDRSLDSRKIAYYAKRIDVVEVIEDGGNGYRIQLTNKGQKRAVKSTFDDLQVPRQKHWDRRWRLVVFDIPEQHKASRQFLSEKLKTMGFYMLQRSLWIHPFPCLEQISLIKHVLPELETFIVLLETDNIDQHNNLVKHFAKILPL